MGIGQRSTDNVASISVKNTRKSKRFGNIFTPVSLVHLSVPGFHSLYWCPNIRCSILQAIVPCVKITFSQWVQTCDSVGEAERLESRDAAPDVAAEFALLDDVGGDGGATVDVRRKPAERRRVARHFRDRHTFRRRGRLCNRRGVDLRFRLWKTKGESL